MARSWFDKYRQVPLCAEAGVGGDAIATASATAAARKHE
jgi:hypothetical protein